MPGIFVMPGDAPIGKVIDDLILLEGATDQDEWRGRVLYLPLD